MQMTEAVVQRCSVKKAFLERLSKNTFLHRKPLVAASEMNQMNQMKKFVYAFASKFLNI